MTTKFKIGDTFWYMWFNQPTCEQVCAIKISSKPEKFDDNGNIISWQKPTVRYAFWDVDALSDFINENLCYATKEELKKAVFGE